MLIYFNTRVLMHSCILYILKTTPIKVHEHFHYTFLMNIQNYKVYESINLLTL